MPAKDREWGPPPPGLVRGAVGEGSPGSFHQPAERYSRRAGRLATPALDAQIHEAHEGVVGFGAGVHGTHRGDPPTRRSRLQPRNAIGRAMRQTQATGDTGGQFVFVDGQLHGTRRLGFRRPVGSNACFTLWLRSRLASTSTADSG